MGSVKDCPFCGGKAGLIHTEDTKPWVHEEYWAVWCSSCFIHTSDYKTAKQASKLWNARVNENELCKKVKEKEGSTSKES